MSKKKNKSAAGHMNERDELSALKKMARLLEILVRLNLQAMRGNRTQGETILMLDSIGCEEAKKVTLN